MALVLPQASRQPAATADWLKHLNDEQHEAVTHGSAKPGQVDAPPLLVIAGAGTGKTATLTHRVAWLISHGVLPERIALLTFSRRAASEMVRRTGDILMLRQPAQAPGQSAPSDVAAGRPVANECAPPGARLQLPWAGTFHSVASRLLRSHAPRLGLNPAFSIMDRSDAVDLLGWLRDRHSLGSSKKRFPGASTCLRIYSDRVNSEQSLTDVLATRYPWCVDHEPLLRELFAAYVERKLHDALLDYDDLLLWWRHGMQEDAFKHAVQAQFDHILVDEFQDSNRLQIELVRQLSPSGNGVFAVGDDAQSIYSFRGADVKMMYQFSTFFERDTRQLTLHRNYRSVQAILNTANTLMAAAAGPYNKNLVAAHGRPGLMPELVIVRDDAAQADYIIDQVLEAREAGVLLKQQAVLFRSAHHSDLLEVHLARRNVPFVKHGGLRFVEAAHVRDYLALLRWAYNPQHFLAGFRTLQMLPGVGAATARGVLDRLAQQESHAAGKGFEPLGRIPVPAAARADWPAFCTLMQTLSASRVPWRDKLEAASAFTVPLVSRRYDGAVGREADLQVLQTMAERSGSAERFLSDMALDPPGATGAWSEDAHLDEDFLILSTVHSAKGQEWDNVFVLNVADGNFPNEYATGSAAGLEEERRLLYVAMTRARERLHLVEPQRYYLTHQQPGGAAHVYGVRSRFLDTAVLRTLDETVTDLQPMEDHLAPSPAPHGAAVPDGPGPVAQAESPAVATGAVASALRGLF